MFRRLPALRNALPRTPARRCPSAAFRVQLPAVTAPTGRRHINVRALSKELIEQQNKVPRFQRHVSRQVVNVVNPEVIGLFVSSSFFRTLLADIGLREGS